MEAKQIESVETTLAGVGITDEDIYEAMKSVSGYIDITMKDFKEIYCLAHTHATERFARAVAARDIMTKNVLSARPDMPLVEVAQMMASGGVSGVPVVDGEGRVLGIISEKDFLNRMGARSNQTFMAVVAVALASGGCVSLPTREGTAKDIMSAPPVTVREETTLMDMLALLSQKAINRMPVTGPDGRLVGIVARSDLVSSVFRSRTC